MSFKNNLIQACLLSALFAGSAMADPVTLTINGRVIAAACTTGTSASYTIDLGQSIAASALNTAASGSTYVPQDVVLSNCPVGTNTVTATFSGTADSANPTMYANSTGAGYATNVAVELQNATASTDVGNSGTMTVNTDASRKATFPLKARAYSKNGGTTPGNISTVVMMNFTYN